MQAKSKKKPTKENGTTGLCDSFWACVLNDYIEDDTEYGLFESRNEMLSSEESVAAKARKNAKKRRRREKKKRIIMAIESVSQEYEGEQELEPALGQELGKELEQVLEQELESVQEPESEEDSIGHELDNLLSDDPDDHDIRDSSVPDQHVDENLDTLTPTQEPVSYPSTRDIGPEEELTIEPVKKEVGHEHAGKGRYNGMEAEENVRSIESDTEGQPHSDIIHYAPLSYGESRRKAAEEEIGEGNLANLSISRVPIDPEEGPSNYMGDQRRSTMNHAPDADINNVSVLKSPRDPSASLRFPSQSSYRQTSTPTIERAKRNRTVERRRAARAETIDLTSSELSDRTMQLLKATEQKAHLGTSTSAPPTVDETSLGQMLLNSQRAEKEYRRRKIDRKEALNRIRAIKARLQTVDA